jgi:hypothetical protein
MFLIEPLHIEPTDGTPEIILNPEGMVTFRGRGLVLTKSNIYNSAFNWIDEYISNPAEITYVNLSFEYLNSYTTALLLTFLKTLIQVTRQSKKLVINWYYEPDDEDILERGEFLSSSLNTPFKFIETSSASND